MTASLDLPPTPSTADPVILPGLLSGLGITRRPVPRWVTDPNVADSIARGFIELPDESESSVNEGIEL